MDCINCEGEGKVFAIESYPCTHCGERLNMEYYMCADCGLVWRTIDGVVDKDSLFTEEERVDFEVDGMERALNDLIQRREPARSMNEFINRCLNCNALSYEVKQGSYECSECGFRWEVIECE